MFWDISPDAEPAPGVKFFDPRTLFEPITEVMPFRAANARALALTIPFGSGAQSVSSFFSRGRREDSRECTDHHAEIVRTQMNPTTI
jgi:hypothetical protein